MTAFTLRRGPFLALFLVVELAGSLRAQEPKYYPKGEQIPGPAGFVERGSICCWSHEEPEYSIQQYKEWREELRHYRMENLIYAGYHDEQYAWPELKWAQSSFIQPLLMVQDRYFYDPVAGKYTVDRYLDDLDTRYGGIDSVLVWHIPPNIGVDARNQYDWLRDMPGGIASVRQMVAGFHRRGVRVLFPVMLWDQGTRNEGVPNWDATARLLAEVGADGVNGDTAAEVPQTFRQASDAIGHPLVLEPECAPPEPMEALAWNNMTWGYWKYPFTPMVSVYKWLEPRHMVNVCDRWNRDKTDNLQFAFFNGVGYVSWENIWSLWNQITPRDAEALRRVSKIERANAELLISHDWEPHTLTLRYGVFATKFPGKDRTLWTLVNRNEFEVSGRQITVPFEAGVHFLDLWHGIELKPETLGNAATLNFDMEENGFGALLMLAGEPDASLQKLLADMHRLSQKPLRSFSHERKSLPQRLVEISATKPASTAPNGMVRVPHGDFLFDVHGIMIEGGNFEGLDVQEPWEESARRHHQHQMRLKAFYIDRYPVTNEEFKRFLDAARYRPLDDHNFIRDWKSGMYPEGWAKKPVTWVSIEDARAYAAWAGKRLPHEFEWQYAAQGTDGRRYPWGDGWRSDAVPSFDTGRELPPASDVDAHPAGASPFGVMDLVGNVWQWTDEFQDDHSRGGILRGGSHYRPVGARWYFPEAFRLDEHGKFLLMAPSTDRAGTVIFRCVVDAQ